MMTHHKTPGLIFDGDDTLWASQVFYDEAKERFYEIVAREGGLAEYFQSAQLTVDHAMRFLDEIEMCNIEREGFSRDGFSQSLVQAYEILSRRAGVAPDSRLGQRLRRLGNGALKRTRSPLPGTRETLEALSGHGTYVLVLYSQGDEEIQLRKLRETELEEFFEGHVHIALRKDDDTLRALIEAENLDIPSSWMIGNSLRSEINPALRLGLNCIWFRHAEWAYDQAEERESGHLFEIRSLPEALEIIERAQSHALKGKGAKPE